MTGRLTVSHRFKKGKRNNFLSSRRQVFKLNCNPFCPEGELCALAIPAVIRYNQRP